MSKTEGMKFPMTAVVKCHVGKAEYAPGSVFDALDIDNVNYLKVTRSAQVGDTTQSDPTALRDAPSQVSVSGANIGESSTEARAVAAQDAAEGTNDAAHRPLGNSPGAPVAPARRK
jgi:hypothetical protein